MKNGEKKRRSAASRRAEERKRAERMKFLRQNTWLILLAVLMLIALVLFICVLAGSSPDVAQQPQQPAKNRYVTAYLCADTPEVP